MLFGKQAQTAVKRYPGPRHRCNEGPGGHCAHLLLCECVQYAYRMITQSRIGKGTIEQKIVCGYGWHRRRSWTLLARPQSQIVGILDRFVCTVFGFLFAGKAALFFFFTSTTTEINLLDVTSLKLLNRRVVFTQPVNKDSRVPVCACV